MQDQSLHLSTLCMTKAEIDALSMALRSGKRYRISADSNVIGFVTEIGSDIQGNPQMFAVFKGEIRQRVIPLNDSEFSLTIIIPHDDTLPHNVTIH